MSTRSAQSQKKGVEIFKPNILTADDFFSGGDLQLVSIPSLSKNGSPGQVYLRQLPAGVVLDFIDLPAEGQTAVTRRKALMKLIAHAVVTPPPDSQPMFTEEHLSKLDQIPVVVFNELSLAVTEMAGLNVGSKGTEGAESAAPPSLPAKSAEGKGSDAPLTAASSIV